MTEFIIFSRADILTLCDDKPVTVYIDKKPYVLCTDEYFEKQRKELQESEYQRQVEQYQYDTLYEPTFDSETGSM